MGFYGNITNTARTQFQFDRTYSSRYDMDKNTLIDGIYAGRYVLVEYDMEAKIPEILTRFYPRNQGNKIVGSLAEGGTLIQIGTQGMSPQPGDLYYSVPLVTDPALQGKETYNIYVVEEGRENTTAHFRLATNSDDPYVKNYNIDIAHYGQGRGYDSTVWQKVYTEDQEKYVMIAELNTVVPTFDVSADAPTMSPIIPHFDINSTDVYYKLHWQPSWGMRVAAGTPGRSDETTTWLREVYDQATGVTTTQYYDGSSWVNLNGGTAKDLAAAIFYNNAGFDAVKSTHISGLTDEIQIRPTGKSGNKYNTHDGYGNLVEKEDIQEMSVILPSIGNAIADVWDVLYGVNTSNENKRYRDIEWKDAVDIEKDTTNGNAQDDTKGGMTRSLGTVAGCINSVHDLMGMIITDKNDSYLNETWFDKNYIYKDGNSYYRIHKYPLYTEIVMPTLPSASTAPSDQEYNVAYEKVINEILKTYGEDQYYILKEKVGNNWQVELLNHQAISKLKEGDKLGVKNGQYGYEFVEIESLAQNLGTIHGCILQMKNLLEVEDSETRDQTTVTGAINALNDIIKVFEHLVPGEFLFCDLEGHVNSANWTTEQPFSYYNHKALAPQEIKVAKENLDSQTDENRWISLSLDEANRKIELKHIFNKIEDTVTTADKNDSSKGDGINKPASADIDDTIKLYTPIVDAMGHVVGKNTETVTLPYGYRFFETDAVSPFADRDLYTKISNANDGNNTSTVNAEDSDLTADSTQDTLALNPGNKWIQLKLINTEVDSPNKDEFIIAHEVHAVDTVAQKTNLNSDAVESTKDNDKITIQDIEFDLAGHVIQNRRHTYTLPYGFKTITATNSANTVVTEAAMNVESNQIAENTQDTLNLVASNRWVKLDTANEDTIKFGHKLSDFATGTNPNTYYGLTQNEPISSLNTDNKFEVPCVKFDEAGHILEARTHTVELPENFDKITVTVNDNTTSQKLTGTAGTVIPDHLTDELIIAEGNRWINVDADESKNTITFSHYLDPIESTTNETDFNTSTNDKIPVHELKWDAAGHLTSNVTHTYTMPKNFKTVSITNTGAGDANVTITAKSDDLIADNMVDKVTLNAGNRWIQFVADEASNKVTAYHAKPGTPNEGTSTKTGTETPDFGATFEIPEVKYDEAGHIFAQSTHTVKIPLPSLENFSATQASVLTGIAMQPEKGAITYTHNNVGALALTDYTIVEHKQAASNDLKPTDSVNTAFNKLQTQMYEEEANRISDVEILTRNLAQEVSDRENAVKNETDARVEDVKTLTKNLNQEITDRKEAITQEIADRNDAIEEAINELNNSDTAVNGQYVSAVTEQNGIITVERENLPVYTLATGETNGTIKFNGSEVSVAGLGSAAYTSADDYAPATILEEATFNYGTDELDSTFSRLTISELFTVVAQLSAQVASLQQEVARLNGV